MRKSKAVTLSLLGTAGFVLGCAGSNPTEPTNSGRPAPPTPDPLPQQPAEAPPPRPADEPTEILFEPDYQWFDAAGNPIPTQWRDDGAGGRVPVGHPHDAIGRPWDFDKGGFLVPPPPVVLRGTRLIGGLVYAHAVGTDGRPKPFATVTRGGLGGIGGRTAGGGG